jgi:hypothetical protein
VKSLRTMQVFLSSMWCMVNRCAKRRVCSCADARVRQVPHGHPSCAGARVWQELLSEVATYYAISFIPHVVHGSDTCAAGTITKSNKYH